MIARSFLNFSEAKLGQYVERIDACINRLSDDDVWSRGHATENSVGNLCLHLAGNVRQWIVVGIGGESGTRNRDAEFAAQGGQSRTDLIANLTHAVEAARRTIASVTAERLHETITVQGYQVTVLEAIYHVVEHFAGHTGQIIFATKALLGEDLGFYQHLKRAGHGETTP
jgi:uncharacterized damage-inducible protein DinB